MLLADAEAAVLEHIVDLADGSRVVIAEIADDHIRLIHEHARPNLQGLRVKPRIDVGKIIMTADGNLRDVLFREAEKGADAVGGGSHFLDDLVHFFDGRARLGQRQLMFLDLLSQAKKVESGRIAFRQGRQ